MKHFKQLVRWPISLWPRLASKEPISPVLLEHGFLPGLDRLPRVCMGHRKTWTPTKTIVGLLFDSVALWDPSLSCLILFFKSLADLTMLSYLLSVIKFSHWRLVSPFSRPGELIRNRELYYWDSSWTSLRSQSPPWEKNRDGFGIPLPQFSPNWLVNHGLFILYHGLVDHTLNLKVNFFFFGCVLTWVARSSKTVATGNPLCIISTEARAITNQQRYLGKYEWVKEGVIVFKYVYQ